MYVIVLEGEDLGEFADWLKGETRRIVARPKTEDPKEVFGLMRYLAGEWFIGEGNYYAHASPDPTGGYIGHRDTGSTLTIEEVSKV
jgi:hypothetical protein